MGKCTCCSLRRTSPPAHLICSCPGQMHVPLGGRMINEEASALEPYTGDYLWNRRLSHNHHCVHCLSKSWYTCELSSYGFLQKSFIKSKVGTVNVVKDGHHSLSDCFAILHNVGQNGGCCSEQVHIALWRSTIRTSSRCHHTEYCSFRQKKKKKQKQLYNSIKIWLIDQLISK